jgi:hypothetical protein
MIILGKYWGTEQKGTSLPRVLARDRFGVIASSYETFLNIYAHIFSVVVVGFEAAMAARESAC